MEDYSSNNFKTYILIFREKEKSIDDILKEEGTLALLIEKAKGDPETYEKLRKLMGI